MATADATNPKATAVAARGQTAAQGQSATVEVDVSLPSRREFLYYIWGASIAMVVGEIVGATLWFAYPRFRAGEFGGTFTIEPSALPPPDGAPIAKPEGRFWLSRPNENGQDTFVALYNVCTHLGCLPKWVDVNNRFECPCHGSKYQKDGHYISGPAPRSLDRFVSTITYSDGTTAVTDAAGDPIPLDDSKTIVSITINTGARIKRNGKV